MAPGKERQSQREPLVSIRGVRKSYGKHEVLRGVSLDVQAGEVTILLGPSGSGKSTLLRCINHLESIDGGRILVDGELIGYRQHGSKIYEMHPREIMKQRKSIGVVFQRFNLFPHMTVLDNVMEGPLRVKSRSSAEVRTHAMELLNDVGMADKAGEHPIRLSGGQQQRVAIARALAMRPAVMLFDEPTSALDPELIHEVLAVMRRLAESHETTMIVVTHEMGFAREVATRMCFFHDGVVLEEGTPDQMFARAQQPETRRFLEAVI